jgi:DNA-binding MarR family transcriptional regulator
MKGEQLPLWKIERRFVRTFFSMVDEMQIAAMGVNAYACLIVIRRHVPMNGSSSFPSAATIAKYTALSQATVYKAIKVLEEHGWLVKKKAGRKNVYSLSEHLFAKSTDPEEREDKVLTLPFGVTEWKKREGELKQFEQTGTLPAHSPILIQNATFHITVNNFNDNRQQVVVKMDKDVLKEVPEGRYREWLEGKLKNQAEQMALKAIEQTPDSTKS